MTSDEILNEPAGPRMDAWVTEYVMGVKPRDVRVCGSDEIVTVYNANKSFNDGGWGKLDLLRYGTPPNYSTDIAAAWEVWNHMRSRPFSIRQRFVSELEKLLTKTFKQFVVPWPDAILFFREDIICRAALLATLEE